MFRPFTLNVNELVIKGKGCHIRFFFKDPAIYCLKETHLKVQIDKSEKVGRDKPCKCKLEKAEVAVLSK